MKDNLHNISKKMVERYSARYHELGYDIKTLGWGSEDQQSYRFLQTLNTGLDFKGKRILDIGCGFGDYADFLVNKEIEFSSYYGVDINPDLINEANVRHKENPEYEFRVLNLTDSNNIEPIADVGIMLGLLNLNLQGEMDNYEYSFNMINNALSLVKEALIVDFISIRKDANYPEEDFIFYHDPARVMEFAFGITDNVLVKHDYLPIPQKEFMLVLHK
ncbi:MAG: methyltransferase domain-containing protein [Gammaproteobacteria bacterium]|nr:methyltransferase domain-containing protein [Gammaproteobacteria bacterium]